MPENATASDYLQLYFNDEFWSLLVTETNRFADQYLAANRDTLPRHSLARKWKVVGTAEMKVFIGLYFLMGIVWKPELDQYWCKDPYTSTPGFGQSMSRDRWLTILQFLHYSNNETADAADKVNKIRPLITLLTRRFQEVYTPSSHISIDEELVAWKGRLSFRQFIPSKRARFGIKVFALCEDSGYLYNFVVYVGKDNMTFDAAAVRNLGASGAVVAHLMQPLNNKGYKLFIDNWYSSIPLALHLSQNGTGVCGTVRRNRVGLPKQLTNYAGLRKGQFVHRSNDGMVFVKLRDTKEVCFLSTMHRADVTASGKHDRQGRAISKLSLVQDYNRFMGGVDRNDEMVSFYTSARKSYKWYKKLAGHIMEEAFLNAYLLQKKNGGSLSHYDFVRVACSELIDAGKLVLSEARAAADADHVAAAVQPPSVANHIRLTGRHFSDLIPPTPKKATPQKRCIVCTARGVRKESRYHCEDCPGSPGLCAGPCYKTFHTKRDYGQL